MMAFGERYRVTIFGSSHGPEVGVSIDGIPVGTPVDAVAIQSELDRRDRSDAVSRRAGRRRTDWSSTPAS